jgi:phosphoribosylaminoimidazolecarboxamide formyltransferase / IMP cyclohydrolase
MSILHVPGASATVMPRRALFSVSDKTHLQELATSLHELGCELFATSSTRAALESYGLPVKSVEGHTGFPEILGGRVKTLHPAVFGGILARPTDENDQKDLAQHGLSLFDLVVCTLYPFQETLKNLEKLPDTKPVGETLATLIEKVDIGGVSLLRAAAKNFAHVGVICDPNDVEDFLVELAEGGGISLPTRARLAVKALEETAAYDAVISSTLKNLLEPRREELEKGEVLKPYSKPGPVRKAVPFLGEQLPFMEEELPSSLHLQFRKVQNLRYGENPHQAAAFYETVCPIPAKAASLARMSCFHGKELSYNNVLDVEHAVRLANEFSTPTAVIVKHNMPCGVGTDAENIKEAYLRAFESDKISPFGGIVCLTRDVTYELAQVLVETFLEVVVAPGFSPDALSVLQRKKNLRLVSLPVRNPLANDWQMTHVQGGMLLQRADKMLWKEGDFQVVTKVKPSAHNFTAARFAYAVVKHVRSNAIVLANGCQTLAIAGGFTNRVDAVKQVLAKCQMFKEGSVLASDAFFPFPDSIEALRGTGVATVIQPGGSVQDKAVIEACDALGLSMIFTGTRHFKH